MLTTKCISVIIRLRYVGLEKGLKMSFKAGDVVQYQNGNVEYLVAGVGKDKGKLFVNACSKSYIDRGLSSFAEKVYPFTKDDEEICKVVDHYGDGSLNSAVSWYKKNKNIYV